MRETATTDSLIADMVALVARIEQEINGKPPSASGLSLFVAMNSLSECVYQHQLDERMTGIMRLADNFGQAVKG
jgi:hypothetical protein